MPPPIDHKAALDVQLVAASQAGDMVAFEELVARHRDKIYARAFSMMRNEEEAIDLSQEAWVKAWQRLKQFQGDSSFATWMTRIVINLCLDQLRRQKRTRAESIEQLDEELGGDELFDRDGDVPAILRAAALGVAVAESEKRTAKLN
ncbi:MAG: sigma-70 family RNA polymerase sigma factor [Proteobacteria bacterium]|nr:sigma-70 family RNA polymerase sigma factor [Pseudomonadota bacterium]